jgi:hypothetical protein
MACPLCKCAVVSGAKRYTCSQCELFCGCDSCWPENGTHCGKCGVLWCERCSRVRSCESCLELFCPSCGDFKPGKDGEPQCCECQPWFKRHRPASDFCTSCGSSRKGHVCLSCESRVCSSCPSSSCSDPDCDAFYCDACDEGIIVCPECEEFFCRECLSDHDCE